VRDDKRRFIIVGTGRSGSSLLAAILADAGANFAMAAQDSWVRGGGAYEHRRLVEAYTWYNRANVLRNYPVPHRVIRYCMRRCRAKIRAVFDAATFAKYPAATSLVYLMAQEGFRPVVIVSYRPFAAYALSRWQRSGLGMKELIESYVDTYQTTLLQLRLFGGCVVDYADIVHPDRAAWIEALAHVTGLETQRLQAARAARVEAVHTPDNTPAYWEAMLTMDERPAQIYSILQTLNGQSINPPV